MSPEEELIAEAIASGYELECPAANCRAQISLYASPAWVDEGELIRPVYTAETRAAYPAAEGQDVSAPRTGVFTVCPECFRAIEIAEIHHAY